LVLLPPVMLSHDIPPHNEGGKAAAPHAPAKRSFTVAVTIPSGSGQKRIPLHRARKVRGDAPHKQSFIAQKRNALASVPDGSNIEAAVSVSSPPGGASGIRCFCLPLDTLRSRGWTTPGNSRPKWFLSAKGSAPPGSPAGAAAAVIFGAAARRRCLQRVYFSLR